MRKPAPAKAAANTPNAASVKGFKHLTVAQVEAGLRKANGYITIAARIIGCDPSTIRRHVKQSPKLAALIDDLTDSRLDTAELSLDAAIGRGEGWAVCFFLKTMGKKRGYVERQEVTGAEGGDLVITVKYEDGANG